MSSLLSQLALTSQNKFFLKSPPKARKKAAAGQAADSPDADLVMVLDVEADSSFSLSPTSQYANIPSAGLESAICDLVSLDSQAEVEQGIFLREWGKKQSQRGFGCFLCAVLHYPKPNAALPGSLFFLLLEFFGKN